MSLVNLFVNGFMLSFLKSVFRRVFSLLFAWAVFLFLLIGTLYFFVGSEKKAEVKSGSALVLDLNANISDSPPVTTAKEFLEGVMAANSVPNYYLMELVEGLKEAAQDPKISSLFMKGSLMPFNYGSGYPVLSEVRDAIEAFKESGKPVVAYIEGEALGGRPRLRDYYLMSAADHLYMHPQSSLPFWGIAAEGLFFGNAFEKYGIGAQLVRVGKFKGAGEVFVRDSFSPETRAYWESLLGNRWNNVVEDIAFSRKISAETIFELSETDPHINAKQSVELGLVDEARFFDEVLVKMESIAGINKDTKTFNQVRFEDYVDTLPEKNKKSKKIIAALYVEGAFVDGEGYSHQVGSQRIAKNLRDLRNDDDVKAVVLRVNSPGGSAIAADVIGREVEMLQKKKPVIVSFGNYAASAGYYIGCLGDYIFAEPTTITGSIGTFMVLFNFQKIGNDHGLNWDIIKATPFADTLSSSRPKTEAELATLQESANEVYDEFINVVARGRGMDVNAVKAIAGGRGWSGTVAKEIGLVDGIGGMKEAIDLAVETANLEVGEWYLKQVPEEKSPGEAFADIFKGPEEKPIMHMHLGHHLLQRWLKVFQALSDYNDPMGLYMRLPFDVDEL